MLSSSVYIVNASFRLPSASNWSELSKLKVNASNPITQIDTEFWNSRNIVLPDSDEKLYGGIIESPFFADLSALGIGQNEWSCLDPQQRLCLSLAQELTTELTLPQNTSVFIGASDTGWSQHNTLPPDNRYLLAGSHLSMTSARISYHFDLTAKSKTIDTSCSSALVAISEAFESILSGDSELSICGGVNLFNDPFKFAQLRRMKMLSPDNQCFTFKQKANGYVRSEGGVLFLLASENSLHKYNLTPLARINGCFVNHDGLSAGITAPSLQSQISLHQDSLSTSGLKSTDIGYIECHGTGTPLGDPIELKALHAVFNTKDVFVGSIKSKVGHLEAAAGAAGVLNCLSFFQDHHLARVDTTPSTDKFSFSDSSLIHLDNDSEYLDNQSFTKSTLVSSFGFSGTNASLTLSPFSSVISSSHLNVGLFPGQGKFDVDLGLHQYNSSSIYRQSADSYWGHLRSILLTYSIDAPANFGERSLKIIPLFQQYISLVHLLSLYDVSIQEGAKYDYLIGYSFGEYAASVAGSALSFEDCIRALYEREKLVEPHRGLFYLYYIEHAQLTPALLDQYLPKEVIVCSPSSSIYAISSTFFEQIKSSRHSNIIKFVGVDYCYHSSILVDKDCLSEAFIDIKLDFSGSNFLPSWDSSSFPSESSWTSHFVEPLRFNQLLSRLLTLSSSDVSFVEISSKSSLKRIVTQNLPLIKQYSVVHVPDQISPAENHDSSSKASTKITDSISSFILEFISQCSGLDISSIDTSKTFTRCGLDSLELAQLISKLSTNFSINFSLDEFVGSFHVIKEAIQEAVRRFSSIPDLNQHSFSVTTSSLPPSPLPSSPLQTTSPPLATSQPLSAIQQHSRAEIVHSVALRDLLVEQLKGSCSRRNSFHSLADPRYSASYSSLYREYQVPLVADSASGAHITTVDGLKYLDFTMGFGVQLFGHNPSFIQSTLLKAIENNSFFVGPQSQLASLNSKLLCDLTCHERALFCNTGTEAVMTAVRLSRAFTKRKKILIFNGSYHGHNDFTLAAQSDLQGHTSPSSIGTPPSYLSDTLITDYNDLASIERLVHENKIDLAAIIVEPIQSRQPSVDVVKTLRLLRRLCDDYNIVLIFDEVLIGFRCHYQSSYGYFAVKSDLSTYGKIIGGGLPIGAVAGNADILNLVDGGAWYQSTEAPSDQRIFFAGTFNKNPLTMVCCHQVLSYILNDKGRIQFALNNSTRRLCRRLNKYFISKGVQIRIAFASSLFRFTGAPLAFYLELLSRKIYIWEGRTCFLSSEHSNSDLKHFESSVCAATESLIAHGVLDSPDFIYQDSYLLARTQLSLCASYSNLPIESQSFNQIVSISQVTPSEFPAFFDKAVSLINSEIALFGIYDLVESSFTPSTASSIDWIRYYNDDSFEWIDFHPSNSYHVQCAVVFHKHTIKEIHFCFAHYAIDGKGINDLFLRIFETNHTISPPTHDSEQSVDLTEHLLTLLSKDHFKCLERGSSVKRFDLKLSYKVRLRLIDIAESYSITLPTLLLSFYINALQSKFSCQSLVVALFGTNSLAPREAYLYSSFIAPIPLVIDSVLDFNDNVLSLLQQTLSQLVLNSSCDASAIAAKFNISASSAHYPLTSFAFNFDKVSPIFSNSSFDISFNKFVPSFPRWNIFLNVVDDLDSLHLSLDYNPLLFDESYVNHVIQHFLNVTKDFDSATEEFLPLLPFEWTEHADLTPDLISPFASKNYLSYLVSDFTCHSISSDAINISCDDLKDKLNLYSSILSQYPDSIFCIRSNDIVGQIISILSCWNVGRAYILWNPLESHDFNISRLLACGVQSLINSDHTHLSVESLSHDSSNSFSIESFDSLAHLIFTSGSTGDPKPVPVSIYHLSSYQSSISDRIPLTCVDSDYRFGVLSSLNYDFPFTTILLWLKHGGELFLADYQSVKSPAFWSGIPDNFFSFIKILPPFFSTLSEFVPIQKIVPTDVLVFGGDKLRNTIAHQCFSVRDCLSIFTHYGPTETCIGCSAYLVPRNVPLDGFAPVGVALDGYEFTIDPLPECTYEQDFSTTYPVPIGLISIRTNNTYGKYFDGTSDPFSYLETLPSYNTGDVGFLNNGVLSILGRVSGFLKINGHRVYLSDINLRISEIYSDLIFHLLPVPQSLESPSQSDHFVMFYSHSTLDVQTIEAVLRESLPNHFCPQRILHIPSIPLTSNGKVNTSSLALLLSKPDLYSQVADENTVNNTAISDFFRICSVIFSSVSLNFDSNFFQLGGDSLTAIRLSASFHRSGVDLSSDLILTNPDFSDLYKLYLSSKKPSQFVGHDPSKYYLTPSQTYFLHFFDPVSWYFTFLIDCSSSPSFVDDFCRVLVNSSFTAFSFNSSGLPLFCNPASILVVEHSYASCSSFYSDLISVADTAVNSLNPALAVNACLNRVEVEDDGTVFCLCAFPHFLIDYISMQLLLDFSMSSSSDLRYSLGFPVPTFNIPLEIPDHFKQIQNCHNLIVADSDFRSVFRPESYQFHEILLDLPHEFASLTSGYASRLLPYLVASVVTTLTSDQNGCPLIDLEFGSRDYNDLSCSTSIGYFSLHIPCLFDDFNMESLSHSIRDIQANSSSLFSYLSTYPDTVRMTPICSINCIDLAFSGISNGLNIIRHSLSTAESFPLSWSPLMLEAECSAEQLKVNFYFDEKQVTYSTVKKLISHLESSLAAIVSLPEEDTTDIINRLGW